MICMCVRVCLYGVLFEALSGVLYYFGPCSLYTRSADRSSRPTPTSTATRRRTSASCASAPPGFCSTPSGAPARPFARPR